MFCLHISWSSAFSKCSILFGLLANAINHSCLLCPFSGLTLGATVNSTILLLPIYVLIMALLGLGFGMIFSALTTKYRDLNVLIGFGVSLLMYLSAVPYPLSEAKNKFPDWVALFVEYNPLTQIVEGFRYMLLNTGMFSWNKFIYTLILSIVVFVVGLVVFNRTEKKFIDTV